LNFNDLELKKFLALGNKCVCEDFKCEPTYEIGQVVYFNGFKFRVYNIEYFPKLETPIYRVFYEILMKIELVEE
jgi:hypothetical protein